jgi:CubicO group peptidase (beta-lactamase class C family)
MIRIHPSRRQVLAGLSAAALATGPLRAQASYGPAIDRARELDQLNALVIAQDGQIRVAEAIRGPALERAVNVKSVSKTIVAALTGIAIDAGDLPGPAATLGEVAPSLIPQGADPRVAGLTIADLLTMQAGLERTSGGNYGSWVSSRDWVADALSRPFVAEPGSGMLYSTGSYHVLGAVLSEVTGRSLLTLAREGLGQPLGIDIPPWTRDPQGRYMGGNEMALSPLALIRFGEAFRQGGTYDESRVVSADWVRQSFTPRTRSNFSRHEYGYGWFLLRTGGHEVAYARGYGGQMLYVLPSLGLTVAVTSDPTRPARSQGHAGDLNALLTDLIVPVAEALRG